MDENEIRQRMAAYKSFYHVIKLTETMETPGVRDHVPSQQKVHRAIRSLDLNGKRVLDIGCRDGLYSFECEKLGAAEVIGIDNDVSPAAVEFLIPFLNSNVKMHELNLLDLRPQTFGTFDVVIFAGVLRVRTGGDATTVPPHPAVVSSPVRKVLKPPADVKAIDRVALVARKAVTLRTPSWTAIGRASTIYTRLTSTHGRSDTPLAYVPHRAGEPR